jgi:hypothetical protein
MEVNIPEEIQEKLKIIEKEAVFFGRVKPPATKWYISIIYILTFVGSLVFAIYEKNVYQAGFSILLGALYFTMYAQNNEIYKLYSNAQDIINYYRDREDKLKHSPALNSAGR